MQPGMNFYSELPDSYNIVVNTENPIVEKITKDADNALNQKVAPLMERMDDATKSISTLRGDGKESPDAETQQKIKDLEKVVSDNRSEQEKIVTEYASTDNTVKQIIDLALLGNGLLRGADLSAFIDRSYSLLNK